MEKFRRSWQLAQAALRVLAADKELLWFPVLSAIVSTLVVGLFGALVFTVGLVVPGMGGQSGDGGTLISIVVMFLFYLVTGFVVTFFTAGLVGAALIRLRGGDPTFGDGMRIALAHVGPIFVYAVVAAIVGVVVALIRGRGNQRSLGRDLLAGLTQAAWNLATFLAVPIMVSKPIGALDALKESTMLLKRTWGEQIIGNAGIGLVFAVPTVLVIVAGFGGAILLFANDLAFAGLAVVVIAALLLALLAVLQTALSGIYKAAVYLYAAEHEETPIFAPELVRTAFNPA